ncbi:DUF3347 domain-containing protein [Reichenbachiella ulvae]|uniref:DUF3347 domain-containing protein n=1 Tax=Reichenbachiella ulvae TaxID=2980104 RepID=A0ABT3CYB4_9BACT|nr:DUF3347 domain-containing protein [Reichenbachiella ulvae]MCV9388561.1 DUF3347 domain-containing protein [Reichenbachiella ulvae]
MKTTNYLSQIVTMLVAVVVLVACGSKKESASTEEHAHAGHDMESSEMEMTETQKPSNEKVAKYMELKDALVETDAEKASSAAASFLAVLEDGSSLSDLLTKIQGATDVEEQRTAFSDLSNQMYEWAKSGEAEGLYLQYCPMAFNNSGAQWLSLDKEINNPYFGDKMLHCGTVKEEL